jgi:DNA invertase Pin-like site-specific DNA recombinase
MKTGKRYGYVRVSTAGQNTARQEIMMAELGVDRMFVDHASGKNMDRPGYAELMAALQPGDTVIVESYSRMSRSVGDLLDTVARLNEMGVRFVSKKENLDTTTAAGRLMLTVFAGLNAFEREVMLERQREGIDAMPVVNGVRVSGKNGRTYGRKKDEVPGFEEERKAVTAGERSVSEACKRLGISRSKWYSMNERSE